MIPIYTDHTHHYIYIYILDIYIYSVNRVKQLTSETLAQGVDSLQVPKYWTVGSVLCLDSHPASNLGRCQAPDRMNAGGIPWDALSAPRRLV